MNIGDRIRVKESVIVYHHPDHRNQPFDIKDSEGEVVGIIKEWQGRPVTANLPIQVQFNTPPDKKLRVHLKEDEILKVDN